MKKDDDKLEAAYCAAYMDFLAKGKTERRCYAAAIELLTKAGFKELSTLKTLKPGDRVYVHLAAKGAEPYANVVWRKGGVWKWYTEYATLVKPCGTTADGWKTFEVCLVAPEGVDGLGLVLGGRDITPESPCWFDDIGIYRW